VLELRSLHRRYGDVVALEDLSLTVAEGEVVGFVGPNGAGKTTAMRIALGVLEADSGDALDEASSLEIAASIGLLVGSVAVLVPLGARIYEGAVLRIGRPLKLKEAWRASRI
jgi:ABC-type multidrug transport system ATPase subunit